MIMLVRKNIGSPQVFVSCVTAYVACLALLFFTGLGTAGLWDDEAHTAVFAKTLSRTGDLTGWDGRSLYMYRNGSALDASLRPNQAPLDTYVAALSFKCLGETTFAARFPFVLAGLASIGFTAAWVRLVFAERTSAILYSLGLYGLLPPLFLNSRCCRYYTLSLLTYSAMLYFYEQALRRKAGLCIAATYVAATLGFYANPMSCAVGLVSLGVLGFCRDREFLARQWRGVVAAAVFFGVLTIPYAISYRIWDRPDLIGTASANDLTNRLTLCWWYVRDLSTVMMLPVWLGLGAAFAWYGRRNGRDGEAVKRVALLLVFNVLALALVSPQSATITSVADVRYCVAFMPLTAAVGGFALAALHDRSRLIGPAIFFLTICSTIVSWPLTVDFRVRWLLPSMIYEVCHDYPTVSSVVSGYLAQHATQDDTIFTVPDYHAYPLLFYRGDQITLAGNLTAETPLPAASLLKAGAEGVMIDESFPEWVIVARASHLIPQIISYFERPHMESGKEVSFQYELASIENVFGDQTQRPELFWHHFGPVKGFRPEQDGVVILKKQNRQQ